VARFVAHDNTVRLHSTIGYITPADFLAAVPRSGAACDAKPEAAREAPHLSGRGSGGPIQIAQPK
jgi:hypothetical protein